MPKLELLVIPSGTPGLDLGVYQRKNVGHRLSYIKLSVYIFKLV
jgi:hypothetical protein